MGSPFFSPGRMTPKVMIILCLVLVGFIEANHISNEETEPTDVVTADEGVQTWNGMENDDDTITKSNESEDTTEDSKQLEDMRRRKKRDDLGKPLREDDGTCDFNCFQGDCGCF